MTDTRVSRVSDEVLVQATDVNTRISRASVEALIHAPDTTNIDTRVSRVSVEILVAGFPLDSRVSRVSMEALQSLIPTPITGTVGSTQADQTAAFSGAEGFSGTLAGIQADQVGAFSGISDAPAGGSNQMGGTGAIRKPPRGFG